MLKRTRIWRLYGGHIFISIAAAVLLGVSLFTAFPTSAQDSNDLITLTVDPGFDSYFREGDWIPLRIAVSNNGSDIVGRLVVRPETSAAGLTNTFSSPISLPNGSSKTAFLYVTAHSFTNRVRVELLDDENVVYADRDEIMRGIVDGSLLYLVVTDALAGSIDMSGVTIGQNPAFQANWHVDNIPDRAAALDAVDVMLFTNVDTGTLTADQAQAVTDWVAAGGHLIVSGGANWQSTAAGLQDLLPLIPDDGTTTDEMDALVTLAGIPGALRGQAIIATGQLTPDAYVLAETETGLPLVARRLYGAGTVDYLSADPAAQPLQNWDALNGLWLSLVTSVNPVLSWAHGIQDIDQAIDAIEVLPGVNLLPQIMTLCGFLALYIALVGPVNYLVLNRFNRREWAWITIPVFIVTFSVIAWTFGFNFRGDEAMLSRLTVVQSWANADRARVDQFIGLLSPQRSTYNLSMTDDRLLRPVARPLTGGILGGAARSNIDIRQTDTFKAADFPVDASFMASFMTNGVMEKPAISGTTTLAYQGGGYLQRIQGAVRNDSDLTLTDAVILTRTGVVYLEEPLEPGTIQTFSLELDDEGMPQPAALEPGLDLVSSYLGVRYSSQFDPYLTIREIIGSDLYREIDRQEQSSNRTERQEQFRRQALLKALVADRFNSTGRGNRAYLVGWTNDDPLTVEVEGARWQPKDTTVYIVELDVNFEIPPATRVVTLPPDQFTWITQQRLGVSNYTGPFNLRLNPGDEVTFRFTPLPDRVLSHVDELLVHISISSTFTNSTKPVLIWNWQDQTWWSTEISGRDLYIDDPEPFIGPQNAVQIRLEMNEVGYSTYGDLFIEQTGRF